MRVAKTTNFGEVEKMKKIEAVIDPSKMQEVKNALTKIGIRRMTISKDSNREEIYLGVVICNL